MKTCIKTNYALYAGVYSRKGAPTQPSVAALAAETSSRMRKMWYVCVCVCERESERERERARGSLRAGKCNTAPARGASLCGFLADHDGDDSDGG